MSDTCTTTKQLLSDGIDRTLTTSETSRLRAHLATCPSCRAFERDLSAGLTGIARLPRVSGSPAVRAAVMDGVHPGGRSAWPTGWRGWTTQVVKLGGAISGFALVAVILMAVFGGTGTGDPNGRFSGAGSQPGALSEPTATPEPSVNATTAADLPQQCVPGQMEFELQTSDHPGDAASNSPGFVGFTLRAIKSTGGAECRLTTPVSVQISDENGQPIDIQGNPARADIDWTLGAGDSSMSFAWMNWCGDTGRVSLDVEFMTSSDSGTGMGQQIEIAPPCFDPGQPSTLGQVASALAESNPDACPSTNIVETRRQGDDLLIWVIASNLDGCSDNHATVRLTDEFGDRLDVEGNDIDVSLTPHTASEYAWGSLVWSNWCGTEGIVNLDVTRADSGLSAILDNTPACDDSAQPSRLIVSDSAPPDDVFPQFPVSPRFDLTPGPALELPICDPATIDLSLTTEAADNGIIIEVVSDLIDGKIERCAIDVAEYSLSISGANEQLLTSESESITLGESAVALELPRTSTYLWRNWCSADGPVTIETIANGKTATLELASGPACTNADQPTSIQPIDSMVSTE